MLGNKAVLSEDKGGFVKKVSLPVFIFIDVSRAGLSSASRPFVQILTLGQLLTVQILAFVQILTLGQLVT